MPSPVFVSTSFQKGLVLVGRARERWQGARDHARLCSYMVQSWHLVNNRVCNEGQNELSTSRLNRKRVITAPGAMVSQHRVVRPNMPSPMHLSITFRKGALLRMRMTGLGTHHADEYQSHASTVFGAARMALRSVPTVCVHMPGQNGGVVVQGVCDRQIAMSACHRAAV